jgi:hypothetical protein
MDKLIVYQPPTHKKKRSTENSRFLPLLGHSVAELRHIYIYIYIYNPVLGRKQDSTPQLAPLMQGIKRIK